MPDTKELLNESEEAVRNKIEEIARDFIAYFDQYPSRFFAPKTVEMVKGMRQELRRLDELRAFTAPNSPDDTLRPAA